MTFTWRRCGGGGSLLMTSEERAARCAGSEAYAGRDRVRLQLSVVNFMWWWTLHTRTFQ